MKVQVLTSRTEWLMERRNGLGASDAAGVMKPYLEAAFKQPIVRFASPLSIYSSKVGQAEEIFPEDMEISNDDMREAGRLHEPTIAAWFERQTGLHVYDPGEFTICWSAERPHLFCTVDRVVRNESDTNGSDSACWVAPVELKCAWYDAAKEWGSRIPIAYQCQLAHSLYVLDKPYGYFVVLRNGYSFSWYKMERNERFEKVMLDELDKFWECVQKKQEPEADESESSRDALRVLYPELSDSAVDLDETSQQNDAAYLEADRKLKHAKADVDRLKNYFRQQLGGATRGVLPSGTQWTLNESKNGVRTLRRKAAT